MDGHLASLDQECPGPPENNLGSSKRRWDEPRPRLGSPEHYWWIFHSAFNIFHLWNIRIGGQTNDILRVEIVEFCRAIPWLVRLKKKHIDWMCFSTSNSSHLVQTISNEEVFLSNQCSWSKLPQLLDRIVRVCNVPVKNFDMFLLGFLLCSHKFSFNWERIVLHFETSCWPQSGFLHFLLSVGFPRVTGVIGGICVKYLTNICVFCALELNN